MHGIMVGEWVPITISNVEITCHDDGIIQVDDILAKEMKSSLIAIRVYVDHKVDNMVTMECQNVDILMVDNIKS